MLFLYGYLLIAISILTNNSLQLSKNQLNIGFIIGYDDNIARKTISFAIQTANKELDKYNYKLEAKIETLRENSSFNVIRKACNILPHAPIAILSQTAEIPSLHISSFCSRFLIPNLVTNCQFPDSTEAYPMNIKIFPDCNKYATIIYNFITKVEYWSDMLIIYSSNNFILKFENLLNQYEAHFKIRQWVYNDLEKNKEFLHQISLSNRYHHFLVDIPYWQITDFLIMASVHNMSGEQYSYIFTDWDTHLVDISAFKINSNVNVTTFSMISDQITDQIHNDMNKEMKSFIKYIIDSEKSSKWKQLNTNFMSQPALILDSISLLVQGIIKLRHIRPLLMTPLKCSTNDYWMLGTSFFNAITSIDNLPGITGTVKLNERAQRKSFNLTVLQLTEKGFKKSGLWNGKYFQMIANELKQVNINSNSLGIKEPLRVTTIIGDPFIIYKDKDVSNNTFDPNIDAWTGFCIELLNEIGNDLGLNFTIHVVKDGLYGTLESNVTNLNGTEKWSGMIGEIMSDEADLIMAPMTISYERERVVDFTTPFLSIGLSLMIFKPVEESHSLFSFLLPLSPMVWLYVIVAYVGVGMVIFVMSHVTPYELMQSHQCENNIEWNNQFNILNSLWFAFGALVRQGLEFCPQSSSTRMVSGAWWFFTLIIISTYTANLAAFLTVDQMILPINNAEELAKQTDVKYGMLRGGASETFFQRSNFSTYEKMYKFMKKEPGVLVDSPSEGVNKVRNSKGSYAFLLESAMNDYYIQRQCDLMKVGDLLDSKGYGIAFPAGSPLREKMTESILKLQKSQKLAGLRHKWWNEFNITEPCNMPKSSSMAASIKMNQIAGIFLLLGIGYVFAAIVSVLELYVNYSNIKWRLKIPFQTYFNSELRFAMRFMSSSKKPIRNKVSMFKEEIQPSVFHYEMNNSNEEANIEANKNYMINIAKIFTDLDSESQGDVSSDQFDNQERLPNLSSI